MTGPNDAAGPARSLEQLLSTWQAWNSSDVLAQAVRRAETAGDHDRAAHLRDLADTTSPTGTAPPSALDALAAQHEVSALLAGWRWHTVTAAREQGATWDDIAAATNTSAEQARAEFVDRVDRADHAAREHGIPFVDAERYRAAVGAPSDQTSVREEPAVDEPDDDRQNLEDGAPRWSAPAPDSLDTLADRLAATEGGVPDDRLVAGTILLPGGLPPDDDEEAPGHALIDGDDPTMWPDAARWSPDLATDAGDDGRDVVAERVPNPRPVMSLAEVDREAAQDRADRADPSLAPLIEARDHHAADGRFDEADAAHRLVEWCRHGTGPARIGTERVDNADADRREQLVRWHSDDEHRRETATVVESDGSDGGWS